MIVCGFVAGVLNIVPIVKGLSCCLIIPAAAFFSLLLDAKANNNREIIKASKAVAFGLLTGIFAALFGTLLDVLIIFITRNSDLVAGLPELQKLISEYPKSSVMTELTNLLYRIADEISKYGFSAIYTFMMLFGNLIVNSIFGMVGGIIGMQILNNRLRNGKQ